MARHKDYSWNCGELADATMASAQLAVMMDIRDELKAQNKHLAAVNSKLDCYRVRRMLDTVQRIDKRLSKRIKLK